MARTPNLDETERAPAAEAEAPPDALTYWSRHDTWETLGRKVAALRNEAKRRGVPIEALAGSAALIARFKALGRELDRRVR